MAIRSDLSKLADGYRTLGPVRFWLIMVGVLGWIGAGVGLQIATGWPDSFGFHCHGRGCLIQDLWNSPALIRRGGFVNWALFVFFWSMPAMVVGVWGWALVRRLKGARFNLFDDSPAGPQL